MAIQTPEPPRAKTDASRREAPLLRNTQSSASSGPKLPQSVKSDVFGLRTTRGGGGTPYNGPYREAPPERGTFFRLEAYKRVGISRVEV